MKEITTIELPKLLAQPSGILIDVRDEKEHHTGTITGAVNIPIDQLLDKAEELKTYTNIFVHCGGGRRSKQACELLEKMGLKTVINVKGGYRSWKKNNQ